MPQPASSILPYSKDDKGKKSRPFVPAPAQRRVSLAVIFSAISFAVGIGGLAFAAYALLKPPRTVPVFRCGGAEDTLRTFRSKSLEGGDEAGLVVPRPKLVGLVGVQTGFSSAGRRAALRSTWFPSNSDTLLRLDSPPLLPSTRFAVSCSVDV